MRKTVILAAFLGLSPLAVIGGAARAGDAVGGASAGDITAREASQPAIVPPIYERFAEGDISEEPSFQKHVVPLFGRLGCNGRACHGSFQGRGGFRLSLFGYDFKADHEALLDKEDPRVVAGSPKESLIIVKPTDEFQHEGGERYKKDSWQYHVIRRWIESGAKFEQQDVVLLERLDITPSEVLFDKSGQQVKLQVVAVWEDGTREDVTPLCRFQSNDDQVATIDENGLVTATEKGDTHIVVFYDNGVVPVPVIRPVTDQVAGRYPQVSTPTKVDELVVNKLAKLGVVPSDLCTDAEFLRRVSLDMTGTLPTAQEVETFLADSSPNKRSEKIEELLKSDAYAAWWTTRLCDWTGNNDFQLRNSLPTYDRNRGSASQMWYDWIYKRVAENVTYDELVAGIVLATSRDEGQSYTDYCEQMSALYDDDKEVSFADLDSMPLYWARREFREAEPRAINFAYAFMGIRIQCAQCHKHPFDQWSKDDFAEFTNFFRQVTFSNGRPADRDETKEYEEILASLKLDPELRGNQQRQQFGRKLAEGKTVPFSELALGTPRPSRGDGAAETDMKSARLLGGETFPLERREDIRKPLMEWLRGEENPYFAKAFVNRVWASYFGRGIVEPADDLSLANPPVNAPLLDYLAQGFIESDFDMQWVHRTIANSATYQRSWQPNETNRSDLTNFSHAVPRRLEAEVTYDALLQAMSSDERAKKLHDDIDGRSIAIPGASTRNANGNGANFALTVFGRSIRESNCDCDRSVEASLLQTVYLRNDADVLRLLDDRNGWVNQVAGEIGRPMQAAAPSGPDRPDNYDQMLDRLNAQIERARKQDNKKLVQQLERRLAEVKRRFGDVEKEPADEADEEKVVDNGPAFDTAAIVKQAYLRTLSRHPKPEELDRSVRYIDESEDKVAGVRGLLWALVNTKEFIVNH